MLETTFHSAIQADGMIPFDETRLWLHALYSEASLKKFDQESFYHLISHKISLNKLEKNIQYDFIDKKKLIQSLTQTTFCYEYSLSLNNQSIPSNERLEFLGDSIVNFLIGQALYLKYPLMKEGDLSKLRGSLVNEEKLSELARVIDLGHFLFLGKGEFKSHGIEKDSILADAFEALVAAIFLDSKEDIFVVQKFLKNILEQYESKTGKDFFNLNQLELFDPKSKLQELTMELLGVLPVYESRERVSEKDFETTLFIKEKIFGKVTGPSKKKNEKKLAKEAIEKKMI